MAVGDTITNLAGPLSFSFGNYKIEPTTLPEINAKPIDLPQIPPLETGQFSLMTWNVENLFDFVARGQSEYLQ